MQNRIKEFRMKAHMSQEELSKKAGISRTVISTLENHPKTNVSMKTLGNSVHF